MYRTLEKARISTGGGRGLRLTWRIAHDGLICCGPREGKQQTFVLLDEWVPGSRRMARDAALAELARRYFTSHGPRGDGGRPALRDVSGAECRCLLS